MKRREVLKAAAALGIAGRWMDAAAEETRFDYAWLKGQARALAARPWQAPAGHLPASVARLDWDGYQAIRFRPSRALWAGDGLRFRLEFFHLGLFYKTPVRLHEVRAGRAREIAYDPTMFDHAGSGLATARLPRDLGFAGFRVHFHADWRRDVAAFLGASYFRAVGGEMQYGQSARGLAVDCGMDRPEEFPQFVAFWFERPARDDDHLTIWALLDSPSVTGAYRFIVTPGGTLEMEVDAALYPRRASARLGIAPLTSMFDYGTGDRRAANDWRPQIHDSDGLSMWTGSGEWIWRPLANPAGAQVSLFAEEDPRGFGLLQRDRSFDHYQDDGAYYDRRPSVWVEPKAGWGRGSVELVELPARDETADNIVAFWNPAQPAQPGEELLFGYRLHWGARMPYGSALGQVVATRTGVGGVVGRRRTHFSWRFVVDFAGGPLGMLGRNAAVEPVITASRGDIEIPSARPLDPLGGYRAMFDLSPGEAGTEPVELRLFLRLDGQALSETWLYRWTPPPAAERAALLDGARSGRFED
ncbi:MAG TPA: glucan biosynthesis protein D [Rhodocyclaceae bacterium]